MKKMDQFLRHWIIGERVFSWFNISPSPSPNRYGSCGWAGRISFWVLPWPLIGLQSHLHSFLTHILRTAFLRFPAGCHLGPCCSSSWPICSSHENSDPWVRNVFLHRLNSEFHSGFTLQAKGCNFQHESNLGVFSDPTFRFTSSSLRRVYSRQSTESVNCENSSVSFVMKYCPTSTEARNPASVQNLINLSCCEIFSIRSLYLCNRNSLCRIIIIQSTFVLITLGTNEELDYPPTTGLPVLSWQVSYSSHTSASAP